MQESTRFRLAKLRRAVRHPARTVRLLTSRVGWKRLHYALRPPAHGDWTRSVGNLANREYGKYGDYLAHQRSKVEMLDLAEYDVSFRAGLRARLEEQHAVEGRTVLCLAARLGTEVKAFHDVGAFAVGIDLNPGPNSHTVLTGDFHSLIFPDCSTDLVYCNSFDHAFDLPRTLGEIRRVLKPSGVLFVDAQSGTAAVGGFDDWAATSWATVDDLVAAIEAAGFTLVQRRAIFSPWPGEELLFNSVNR